MSTEPLKTLLARLESQGAASSHLPRLAALRDLCERSPHCLGLALVGSFANGTADRISDLDLAAFVADDREAEFLAEADEILGKSDVLNAYGQHRPGQVAFRKYVYLDFASCEFHAFSQRAQFDLRQPYLPVWNPSGYLESLETGDPPPRHETFAPYRHGDDGLIWELVDCIKWLSRGRDPLAKAYLIKLASALADKSAV